MTEQPQFVDNRNGNTLSAAINAYLADLDDTLAADPDLDIVTGYFNPRGYFSISDGLDHVDQVRLLVGAEPSNEGTERWRQPEILGTRSTIKNESMNHSRHSTSTSSAIGIYSGSPVRLTRIFRSWSTSSVAIVLKSVDTKISSFTEGVSLL